MNDDFYKQILAEIIEANQAALALVVASMSRQMDAPRLAEDLRAQLLAAQHLPLPSLATKQMTHVLAAVEAEILLDRRQNH